MLKCQNCGSHLRVDLDQLQAFCPYCGQKLLIDSEQLGQILKEKEKTRRHMNAEEQKTQRHMNTEDQITQRMQLKYKNEEKQAKIEMTGGFLESIANHYRFTILILLIVIVVIGSKIATSIKERKNEELLSYLQSVEVEVASAIREEDYDSALEKANKLQYNKDYSWQEKRIWDQKREGYIEQIQEKIRERDAKNPNYVFIGVAANKLKGRNYLEVLEELKALGFTSVTAQPSSVKPGLFDKNNSIEHIIVGGKTNFTAEDYFLKDTAIIIYYYSK